MIKFNLFKNLSSTNLKKPQTSILRSRVALAITEDLEMQNRMFKDGTYKDHFYNIKKGTEAKFTTANNNRIRETEGNSKGLQHLSDGILLMGAQISLSIGSIGKTVTKEHYKTEFDRLACRATNQRRRNYENLQDEHEVAARTFLKALAIDALPLFRLKIKSHRKPDLKISKMSLAA